MRRCPGLSSLARESLAKPTNRKLDSLQEIRRSIVYGNTSSLFGPENSAPWKLTLPLGCHALGAQLAPARGGADQISRARNTQGQPLRSLACSWLAGTRCSAPL